MGSLSKGFLILDVENGKILNSEMRENTFTNHFNHKLDNEIHHNHEHGSGEGEHHGHRVLAEGLKDCEYIVSHGMGRRLGEDIISFGIKPFVTVELNAKVAAINLEQGRLKTNDDLICQNH